jgi:hypothetical protein
MAGGSQPPVADRPGQHHLPQTRRPGDRRRAGEGLATLGGGIPVRVVAELGQHPSPQHHPKPELALHDPSIPVGRERLGERDLQHHQLFAQAGDDCHRGCHDLMSSRNGHRAAAIANAAIVYSMTEGQ